MTDLRERLLHELQSNKASYVANARGASERMHAALVAVAEDHKEEPDCLGDGHGWCYSCGHTWPCKTLRLIDRKLEVEP